MADRNGGLRGSALSLALLACVAAYFWENRDNIKKPTPAQIVPGKSQTNEAESPLTSPAQGRQKAANPSLYICGAAQAAGDTPGVIAVHGDPRGAKRITASGRICFEEKK